MEESLCYQTRGMDIISDFGVVDLDLLLDLTLRPFLPYLDLFSFLILPYEFLDFLSMIVTDLFFGVFVMSEGGSLKNVETV